MKEQNYALAVIVMVLLLGAGKLAHNIEGGIDSGVAAPTLTRTQQDHLTETASASLFGQFRSTVADFLWLKVNSYLHDGVEIRGLTPSEKTGKIQAVQVAHAASEKGGGEPLEHMSETTVIPAADQDWRGIYGDVEREIVPYKDMSHHTHRDPKEALPLFRLMTLSNPHFISGYTVGAAMIARDHTRYREAIAFLLEGMKNNPESIEIETDLGQLYTADTREYDLGSPHLERAIDLGQARGKSALNADEDEAYENAFRWMVLNRREAGDPTTAQRMALAGLKLYPGDVVCSDYLKGKGSAVVADLPGASSFHVDKPVHGGQIQAIGENHLELVVRPDRSVTLYVMGIVPTISFPLKEETLWAHIKTASVLLHAAPQKDDPHGQSSVFAGQLPSGDETPGTLNISIMLAGQAQQIAFNLDPSAASSSVSAPAHDTSATMVVATSVTPEQRALFLTPGGVYTAADIVANGSTTPDQKFQGLMANHHLNPKKGDRICPITRTTANPKFPWIVGGKRYLFCCPPCVAEFVKEAKAKPQELEPPQTYVQK